MAESSTASSEPSPKPGIGAWIALPLRLAIGGIFLFAAFQKIKWNFDKPAAAPQQFLFAIKSFKIEFLPDWLIKSTVFVMPWMEVVFAICLIIGLCVRASAIGIGLLLLFFMGLIYSAIHRGLEMDHCGCFGERGLFCTGGPDWCHMRENLGMVLACAFIALVSRHVLAVGNRLGGRA